jgi:transcriptional regulator with XRE-family HTH domain
VKISFAKRDKYLYNMALSNQKKCDQTRMFGQKIREIRKIRGLTQAQLNRLSGIGQAAISLYELDRVSIPANRLVQIAQALHVSVDEITGHHEPTDLLKVIEQIKSLDENQFEAILKKRGFGDDAIALCRILRDRHLEPWQIEAIEAILDKGHKKEE